MRIFELLSPDSRSLLRLSRFRFTSLSALFRSRSTLFRSELLDRRFFSGSRSLESARSFISNRIGVRLRFNVGGELFLLSSVDLRSGLRSGPRSDPLSLSRGRLPIRLMIGVFFRSSALNSGLFRFSSAPASFCAAGFFVGKPNESSVTTNCVFGPSVSFSLKATENGFDFMTFT